MARCEVVRSRGGLSYPPRLLSCGIISRYGAENTRPTPGDRAAVGALLDQDQLQGETVAGRVAAGNETARERLSKELKLPAKMTQDVFGFGLVRADGKTPRPAYDWLRKADPNAPLLKDKERAMDVEAFVSDGMVPVGYQYDYAWRQPWVVIKGVKVGTLEPTVIKLQPAKKP